jgi:D-glycero-D-manno-heptose 1,7-bisphosphate phosphatase
MADQAGKAVESGRELITSSGKLSSTGVRQAVFLDRDGVIVENRPDYIKSWAEVRFLEGSFAALRRLAASPMAVVIVSNQSAVGRELMSLETAWELQNRIVAAIEEQSGRIDASYLCPHHPEKGCDCRKPLPGMIHQAARELQLDLQRSWLVGDAVTDVQAAAAAEIGSLLVRTGRGVEQEQLLPKCLADKKDGPRAIVADLPAAVDFILRNG